MASQDSQGAVATSLGERAFALLRTLSLYGLLVAVPVIAYYYAVVERQARARSELALHALQRIQSELDSRLERLDVLLDTPNQQGGPKPALRFAELGVRLLDPANGADGAAIGRCRGTTPVAGKRLSLQSVRGQQQVIACQAGKDEPMSLAIPAEQLLDAPGALRRFERVVLANKAGDVLTSAVPPVEGDAERAAHRPVSALLPPVSIRPWLLQAIQDRLSALAAGRDRVPAPEKDREAALGEPAELAAVIAGERYRIVLLPFTPERALTHRKDDLPEQDDALDSLVLVGIARQSTLAEATSALGVEGLWYLIAALLLTLAAWPLLRVLLVAEHEAVSRPDLAMTFSSVIFIPAVVTLLLIAALTRGYQLAQWDDRARAQATGIAGEMQVQIGTLLDAIDRFGRRYDGAAARRADDPRLLQCRGFQLVEDGRADTCDFTGSNPTYCHIAFEPTPSGPPPRRVDNLFLTDADGRIAAHPFLAGGGCQPRAPSIALASREYFRALSRGNAWPLPTARAPGPVASGGGFLAQRIYSRADSTRTLVVAVPHRDGDGRFAGVYGAVSTARALSTPLLSPLLGYAIVDRASGTVVFHDDDDSSLHENFFEEIDRDGDLIAALHSHRPATVAGHYRGRAHRFAVQPLEALPWVVVSWYATAEVTTPAATAALLAVFEMMGLILALVVVAGVLLTVLVPASRAIGWRTEVWQWLWPQWRLRAWYRWLAWSFVPVIASQMLLWMVLDDASMMLLVIGGSLVLAIAALILLSPSRRQAQGLPGLRRRWEHDPTPPTCDIDTLRELRRGYLAAITMAVIALAVVPAGGLYLRALPIVEEAQLREALQAGGAQIERRISVLNSDLRRTALPEMQSASPPPDARTLAVTIPTPGARWSLDDDPKHYVCTADPAKTPSRVLGAVWKALAGLLPGQSSTFRSLGKPESGPAGNAPDSRDRHCRHTASGERVYRHSLRYGGTAWIADPTPAPGPGRLLRMLDAGHGDFGRAGVLLALLAALAGLLALIRLVAHRVLGLGTPVTPSAPSLGADFDAALRPRIDRLAPGGSEWWYFRIEADGAIPPLDVLSACFPAPEAPLDPAQVRTVNLARPDGEAGFGHRTLQVLVLTHLGRAALSPVTRVAALALLEQALAAEPRVLLLTGMSPPWPRLCQPQDFPDDGHRPDADEALRWRALRARFAVHRVDRADATGQLADSPRIADDEFRRQLDDERIALQELIGRPHRGLDRALSAMAATSLRDLKDFEQIALPLVEPQLRREWLHCTIAERLALHQLARGLLPNPLNRAVLDDLLIRRLVALVPEPRLVCETFRSFVLRAESAAQFEQWAKRGAGGGWQRVRAPFYVILLLLIAWFAYSFRDAFSTLNAVLAGALGLFATIGKAGSLVRGIGSPDSR